jgi:hypothetical protein
MTEGANDNNHQTTTTNLADRTILVHRKDQEGTLRINALSGVIQQEPNERPDWSDGLSTALIGERHEFYSARLGPAYTEAHKHPEILSFEDLGWLTVSEDEDGSTVIQDADVEFRMEVLGEVTGMTRYDNLSLGINGEDHVDGKGTVLEEVELAYTAERSDDEVAAFEKSQEYYKEHKTGTSK